MNAHLIYEPVYPGETYSVTAEFAKGVSGEAQLIADKGTDLLSPAKQVINKGATWDLKSTEGEHLLTVALGNQSQAKNILITTEFRYEPAFELYTHSDIIKITINYTKLKPLGDFSLFGWYPGWLGLYIIFSIIFSIGLRKLFKVY